MVDACPVDWPSRAAVAASELGGAFVEAFLSRSLPERQCKDEFSTATVRCCDHDEGTRAYSSALSTTPIPARGKKAGVTCSSICDDDDGSGASVLLPRTRIDTRNATYFEASHECHVQGKRLCFAEEVSQCCGSGCGFDGSVTWLRRPCEPGPLFYAPEYVRVAGFLLLLFLSLFIVRFASEMTKACTRCLRGRYEAYLLRAQRLAEARQAWLDSVGDEDDDDEEDLLRLSDVRAKVVTHGKRGNEYHRLRAADTSDEPYQRLQSVSAGEEPYHRLQAASGPTEKHVRMASTASRVAAARRLAPAHIGVCAHEEDHQPPRAAEATAEATDANEYQQLHDEAEESREPAASLSSAPSPSGPTPYVVRPSVFNLLQALVVNPPLAGERKLSIAQTKRLTAAFDAWTKARARALQAKREEEEWMINHMASKMHMPRGFKSAEEKRVAAAEAAIEAARPAASGISREAQDEAYRAYQARMAAGKKKRRELGRNDRRGETPSKAVDFERNPPPRAAPTRSRPTSARRNRKGDGGQRGGRSESDDEEEEGHDVRVASRVGRTDSGFVRGKHKLPSPTKVEPDSEALLEEQLARRSADRERARLAAERARERLAAAAPSVAEEMAAALAAAEAAEVEAQRKVEAAAAALEARRAAGRRNAEREAEGEEERQKAEEERERLASEIAERQAAERAERAAESAEAKEKREAEAARAAKEVADRTWEAMKGWRSFHRWRVFTRRRRRHLHLIRTASGTFIEFGDPLQLAMDALKARPPAWLLPAPAAGSRSWVHALGFGAADTPSPVILSDDGFWAASVSRRQRVGVAASPRLTTGVYAFAFHVRGSGIGLVVGLCDATDDSATPSEAAAWGIHLTHGALYSKGRQALKGELSTQQLVPGLDADRTSSSHEKDTVDKEHTAAATLRSAMITTVEVQVDMGRRKVAFGLPGELLIEAPVELSSAVRPWCFLWSGEDCVMLEPRPQRLHVPERVGKRKGKRPVAGTPRGQRGEERPARSTAPPLPPLRSRLSDGSVPIYPMGREAGRSDLLLAVAGVSSPVQKGGSPRRASPRRMATPQAASPGKSTYLPPYMDPMLGAAEGIGHEVANGFTTPRAGATSGGASPSTRGSEPSLTWRLQRFITPKRSQRGMVGDSTTPRREASGRSPSRSPRRAGEDGSRLASQHSRHREERHMWDMVKPVSGAYADAYNAL